MKEEELKPYYRKRIKVIFTDGKSMIGFFEGYNSELDNEPDPPSIDLRNDNKLLYELFLHEIEKIELVQ